MIFLIYNFFKKQYSLDSIGRIGCMLQLTLLLKFIIIVFIFSFYYQFLPWYIYISFSFDFITMIFGFIVSYSRRSVLLFIFFLFSLVLFLFDFIPLVLMNSDIWNDFSGEISPKDIFQSICEILWFSTEVLTMHLARKQRSIIESHNDQLREEKDNKSFNEKKPSLIICVDGYQNESSVNNNNNSNNTTIKQIDENQYIINIDNSNNNYNDNLVKSSKELLKEEQQNQNYSLNNKPLDESHFISIDLSENTQSIKDQNINNK